MKNKMSQGCSTGIVNSYSKVQSRRGRKLPHVQRRKKYHIFWPTYRGAVGWMRQHQDLIDTAIGLLEIYPNIISDSSLDTFWEFVKPFFEMNTKAPEPNNVAFNKLKMKPNRLVLPKLQAGIPTICVTQDSDTEDDSEIMMDTSSHHKTAKVFVAGKLQTKDRGDNTNHIIGELSTFSFVCYNMAFGKADDALNEADSLIFLLSDHSLNDLNSCQKLVSACSLGIPTIFVRNKNFKLPSPLPENFMQLALNYDRNRKYSSYGRRSLSPSVGKQQQRSGRTAIRRSGSATSLLQPGAVSQPSFNSPGLVLDLIDGYRDSIVFDERLPVPSVQELRSCLNRSTDISRSNSAFTNYSENVINAPEIISPDGLYSHYSRTQTEQWLRVPTFKTTECIKPVFNKLCPISLSVPPIQDIPHSTDNGLFSPDHTRTLHLEVPHCQHIEHDPDSGVHSPVEKDTFYLVYPDRNSARQNKGPTIVKWPPDEGDNTSLLSPESHTTLDSPITFNDIDLSAEVNYDPISPDGSMNLEQF